MVDSTYERISTKLGFYSASGAPQKADVSVDDGLQLLSSLEVLVKRSEQAANFNQDNIANQTAVAVLKQCVTQISATIKSEQQIAHEPMADEARTSFRP